MSRLISTLFIVGAAACGSTQGTSPENGHDRVGDPEPPAAAEREAPPESGPARDVSFPAVTRLETAQGLRIHTAEWRQLPVVYLRLVIGSGGETDPANLPGMAHLVGAMLKEGTRARTSAQIAEQVGFLGAQLWVSDDEETIVIGMRALSEHLDQAMDLLADVATHPAFRPDELAKLKRRETDRLNLQSNRARFLAVRELYRGLYGDHPYARVDTTVEAVGRARRRNLVAWHRRHVVPNNALLVAVGDVSASQVQQAAERVFRGWRRGQVPAPQYAEPPTRTAREVVLVDRPTSVQALIMIGNLALRRSHEDYVRLQVANQVLGGSAAARLFMDLRERRSLTYGAYSSVVSAVQIAPFRATAQVRNDVAREAMAAFFEHLDRITSEVVPAAELADAQLNLGGSFPLHIDTPGKIARLVADLHTYGLSADYWDRYRTAITEVTSEQALAAAQQYIHPERALVVVVGPATDLLSVLRVYGPVQVVNTAGEVQGRFDQTTAAASERPSTTSEAGAAAE